MRKRGHRPRKAVGKLLSPASHEQLMVLPRVHLHMVLEGNLDGDYLATIAGVFNIVIALSHLQQKSDRQAFFERAQAIVLEMMRSQSLADDESQGILLQAFNQADYYIGIQQTRQIHRAMQLVEQSIQSGDAVNLASSSTFPI